MVYKLIDEKNIDYINGEQELHNIKEILGNVRETADFMQPILMLPGVISMIVMLFLGSKMLADLLKWRGIDFLVVGLLALVSLYAVYMFSKGAFISFAWRKGIRDKQILENLMSQGKITTGFVTEVSDEILYFEYQVGNEVKHGRFHTHKWDKFSKGDTVAVLYVYNTASCLL